MTRLVSPGGSITAPDGVSGREGTFNMSHFWLVDALTGADRIDLPCLEDRRLLIDQMPGYLPVLC
jgi:hypothetical protein